MQIRYCNAHIAPKCDLSGIRYVSFNAVISYLLSAHKCMWQYKTEPKFEDSQMSYDA